MAAASTAPRWIEESHLEGVRARLDDPRDLAERRLEALRRFRELPIEPDPLYRHYGYFQGVDLLGIDPAGVGPAIAAPRPADAHTILAMHDASGTRLTISPELASAGVTAHTLAEIWAGPAEARQRFLGADEPPPDRLSALSEAIVNRGYRIVVPDRWTEPVRVQDITVLSRPHEALSVRRSLRAGMDSQVLLTEEVYSTATPADGQRFYASALDLDLAAGSKTVVVGAHLPDREAVSFFRRRSEVGAGARLAWVWIGLGGRATKARNDTLLSGGGATVHDLQTFYGDRQQSYDSAVRITHTGTDTHGESITRGVFTDDARGLSRGLVRIEREARRTISFISEHAMLLSRGARSDTLPILEILCRDVKATHSTSVAPVDPEKVFYLESRGVPNTDAIRMIAEGFLSYVLFRAPIAQLREAVQPMLESRWDRREIYWPPDGRAGLPTLDVTGTETAPEWRFDSKLR